MAIYAYTKVPLIALCVSLFAHCIEGNHHNQYIGCYQDVSSQSNWIIGTMDSDTLTVSQCMITCRYLSSTYAILQNGRNCLCGNVLNTSSPSFPCDTRCSGNVNEVCGGSNASSYVIFSVCSFGYYGVECDKVCHCKQQIPCYVVSGICPNGCEGNWTLANCSKETSQSLSARYIGCYGDSEPRALGFRTDLPSTCTIELCSSICASNNFQYAGLEFHRECYCGDSYVRYGELPNSSCNCVCDGDGSQICGAFFTLSVYYACPVGYFGEGCMSRCNCKNEQRCTCANCTCSSGCKSGWMGSRCEFRNCSENNGGCSVNETCVIVDLKFGIVTRCNCKQGYQKKRLWDACTVLDECQLNPNPCNDTEREYCSNIGGSFLCVCKTGFERYDKNGRCEVIDKCKKDICDRTTTNCTGTSYGFVCECLIGNTRLNTTHCEDSLKICEQQAFPLEVVVGASVASGVGSAIIAIVVVNVVVCCRRRRRQQSKKSEDAAENRRTEVADANAETPISLFAYATLNKMPNEYDSAYTKLDAHENRPTAKEIERKFKTGIREQLPGNQFGKDTSEVYEELQ